MPISIRERIRSDLMVLGKEHLDPFHVEAWVRFGKPAVEDLDERAFHTRVRAGVILVEGHGERVSESVADRVGLVREGV